MKIFLTGADPFQWALAEDFDQTVRAIESFANCVESVEYADIIHSVYWESLKSITKGKGQKIICNLSGEWERYESVFSNVFLNVAKKVDIWIVRSKRAEADLKAKGLKTFFVPYTVNTNIFKPIDTRALEKKIKSPKDKYIIGNFMRDTAGGRKKEPKLVKGPDIFLEIVKTLHEKELPIHILLAGPRRHWLRKQLKRYNISYSFYGLPVPFDDMRINTLNRERLNVLYNYLDLSIVSSRSEAGPHAILEAGASQCPQISTNVGIAADIIPAALIYNDISEACSLIEKDIKGGEIRGYTQSIYDDIKLNYTPGAVVDLYRKLYETCLI